MLSNAFGWPHMIVILVVVLLLFGAPKLPGLAKSLGQSMRIFRKEVSTMKEEKAADSDRRVEPAPFDERTDDDASARTSVRPAGANGAPGTGSSTQP